MSVAEVVKARRSIRKYSDQDVPDSLIRELIEQAASLCDRQQLRSTRLLLANRRESKDRLSRYLTDTFAVTRMGKLTPGILLEKMFQVFAEIPGHLAVVVEDHAAANRRDEQYAQACFFMQNFQLLAWERNLGTMWRSDEILYTPAFFRQLGLADGERLAGILHFGFFAKAPRPRSRTPAAKRWLCWPQIR